MSTCHDPHFYLQRTVNMYKRSHDLKAYHEILKELWRLCSYRPFINEKEHKAKNIRWVEKYCSLINQTFEIDWY